MPHANFDDGFADSPSVWRLSDRAYRLHSSGILYCARLKTDGLVPADKVSTLVPRYKASTLAELVEAEKWKPIGLGKAIVSYEIKNYLEWNDSAEQIEARKKAAAERKAAWIARQRNGDHDKDPEHV